MRMSDQGLKLLAAWEGIRLKPYRDAAGHWTIGVGHLMSRQEMIGYADGITKEVALSLLADDVSEAETCVARNVKTGLQQYEFDAIVSFCFNVGIGAFSRSTLLKRLNARDYQGVPQELMKWTRANGKRCAGLVSRREKEIRLWRGEID